VRAELDDLSRRLDGRLNGMKTGDYLFIQFGINDTDSMCPRHVGTALFKTDYGMMAVRTGLLGGSGSGASGRNASYQRITR
jgi:hypothetical protein